MSRHTFKDWFDATRWWSFSVSAMPVVVTFAWLCSKGLLAGTSAAATAVNFILTLAGAVILHAAGNVLSDWSDYRKGVDNEQAYAVPNLVFHHFKPGEYLAFSLILFAAGCAVGLTLVCRSGLGVLYIGLAGVTLTVLYSFLKYRALGDLDIFLIFAPLMILGTTASLTGAVVTDALCLALPVGIITVAVLHANNTLDSESDAKAGTVTFAMKIGLKASCRLYIAYMIIPYLCVAGAAAAGYLSPWCLLCLLSARTAWRNARTAATYGRQGLNAMMGLDKASAALQLQFSLLLAVGLFAAALF